MNLKVIDVSTYQGNIDWEALKPEIDGAIIRCGYGSDIASQDDSKFTRNADECARLGIPFGVYLYSYATNESMAQSEAAHILRLIEPYKLDYPVYLDCEENKTDIQKYAKTACEIIGEIIENAGYTFGVYANLNWWNNYLVGLDNYTKWVAQYNSTCNYAKPYDMWQFTSSKTVSGISGGVDFNECYVDFPALINCGIVEDETISKTETVDERATYTVASGDTLTSIAKKYNTTVSKLVEWNGIENANLINVNQILFVEDEVSDLLTGVEAVTYTVASGDTLTSIAKKFDTTVEKIATDNDIKNVNLIYVGQILTIE